MHRPRSAGESDETDNQLGGSGQQGGQANFLVTKYMRRRRREEVPDTVSVAGRDASPVWGERRRLLEGRGTYSLWWLECGWEVTGYMGEFGRNAYSRGREHLDRLEAKDENFFSLC